MTRAVSKNNRYQVASSEQNQPGPRLGGKLVASKATGAGDVFKKWRGRGTIPGGLSVDAYLEKARDLPRI